ncbi:Hypothetical predicted protein [Pelobates cultripes]|uniref:Uncharacterized protein n=1 Tax=Pelobates cultripes TaxID=61616 RepID=A0AAD1TBA5_PELCU|nr:Hypothetical predicted protein [Pelobates cultripes]
MVGASPQTMPQGLRESTPTRLDAIFMKFWRMLEERQMSANKQCYSPPVTYGSTPDAKQRKKSPHLIVQGPTGGWRKVRCPDATIPRCESQRRRSKATATTKPTHLRSHTKLQPTRRTTTTILKARRSAGHCRHALDVTYCQNTTHTLGGIISVVWKSNTKEDRYPR